MSQPEASEAIQFFREFLREAFREQDVLRQARQQVDDLEEYLGHLRSLQADSLPSSRPASHEAPPCHPPQPPLPPSPPDEQSLNIPAPAGAPPQAPSPPSVGKRSLWRDPLVGMLADAPSLLPQLSAVIKRCKTRDDVYLTVLRNRTLHRFWQSFALNNSLAVHDIPSDAQISRYVQSLDSTNLSGIPHCSRWAFTGGMERLITDSLRCTVSVDSNPLASPTVKICSSDAPPVMLRAEAPTNVFVCSYLFKPGTARYLDTILHTTTHGVCVALERTTGKPAAKWLQPWVDCGRAMCLLEAESLVFRQFDTHSSGKEIWHQQSGLWELYFIKPLNPLDLSQCVSLSSLTIGLQNITQSIRKRGHCAQCFLPIASSPHTRRHASCQL
mmetsp:Transcript_5328/g.9596  ORF Transcript_5328/g.9596 Transcript_5328/m.9596 type:complete len:385 (+) Transcript_5328:2108-3262(+)